MPLPKIKTQHQIKSEISILQVQLDSLEKTLHQEPWNWEARQDFRTVQNRLNSLVAESATRL